MVSKYRNTTGIIFRLFNSKDADKVIHILTESGAKLAAAVPGVKRSTSRKAHAIDLLNAVSLKLTSGKNLDTVTEAHLVNSHPSFKQDYAGLLFTQLVCEILSIFLQEEQEEPAYYRNLSNLLEVNVPHKYLTLISGLILRLLHINGVLPKLSEDVLSGEEIEAGIQRYPTDDIGYTSRSEVARGESVSDRLYKTQRFMLLYDFSQINRINLTPEEQLQLFDLHLKWLELAVDHEIKSAAMFRQAMQTIAT
jgi:DNA repair protein RecO